MKRLLYIIGVAATISLASCDKQGSVSSASLPLEVQFTSSIATKVSGSLWESGDQIGVHQFTELGGVMGCSDHNVAYATVLDGASVEFTVVDDSELIHLPADGSATNFVAYYPFQSSMESGVYQVDLSDQSDLSAIDFMTAVNANQTQESQNLVFTHRLSSLSFTLVPLDTFDGELDGATLFVEDAVTSALVSISAQDGDFEFIFDDFAYGTSASCGSTLAADGSYCTVECLVMPGVEQNLTLRFIIGVETYNCSISATFEPATQYSYTVKLGLEEASISGATIVDWGFVEGESDLEFTNSEQE